MDTELKMDIWKSIISIPTQTVKNYQEVINLLFQDCEDREEIFNIADNNGDTPFRLAKKAGNSILANIIEIELGSKKLATAEVSSSSRAAAAARQTKAEQMTNFIEQKMGINVNDKAASSSSSSSNIPIANISSSSSHDNTSSVNVVSAGASSSSSAAAAPSLPKLSPEQEQFVKTASSSSSSSNIPITDIDRNINAPSSSNHDDTNSVNLAVEALLSMLNSSPPSSNAGDSLLKQNLEALDTSGTKRKRSSSSYSKEIASKFQKENSSSSSSSPSSSDALQNANQPDATADLAMNINASNSSRNIGDFTARLSKAHNDNPDKRAL